MNKRPYVPVKVRLAVLERQAFIEGRFDNDEDRELALEMYHFYTHKKTTFEKVCWLIEKMFGTEPVELDHDPALELRHFNKRTGKYSPDANNPKFMVYRTTQDHLRKTIGRKPGAERTITSKGSDTWLAKKFRKLESPKKVKRRIQSRPFPKRQGNSRLG